MVKGFGFRPGPGQHPDGFLKAAVRLRHRNVELVKLPPLIAPAHAQIQPPVAQHIHRGRFLGNLNGIVKGQHGDGRRQADAAGQPGQVSQHRQRGGNDAVPGKVMLGHPDRIVAQLFRPQHLLQGVPVVFILPGRVGQLNRMEKPKLHRFLLVIYMD